MSAAATPCLYYKVELNNHQNNKWSDQPKEQRCDHVLRPRIQSLLKKPENLQFVRVLDTGWFGWESTKLMDRLLPLFREDHLIRFSYLTRSCCASTCVFPTPLQMQYLWGSQTKLQKLELCSHMVPALEESLKKQDKPRRSVFLNSFTKLDIGNSCEDTAVNASRIMHWPLMNLDTRLLRSFSLNGKPFPTQRATQRVTKLVTKLTDLFAAGSFVNLTKLSFEHFEPAETLTVTNVPLLEFLTIAHCEGTSQTLAFPEKFRLRSLTYMVEGAPEKVTSLLGQIRGLESLVIKPSMPINPPATAFTVAITLHKETLLILKLRATLPY